MVIAVVAACAVVWQRACWQCSLCTARGVNRSASSRSSSSAIEQPSGGDLDQRRAGGRRAWSTPRRERPQPPSLDFDALVDSPRRRSRRADGSRRRRPSASKAPADARSSRSLGAGTETRARRAGVRPSRRDDRFALPRSTGRTARRARPTTSASTPRSLLRWRRARRMPGTLVAYSSPHDAFRAGAHVGVARAARRVRHRPSERAPLRGRRSPAPPRSRDRCRQPPWLRARARPGSRSGHRTGRPLSVVLVGIERHRDSATTGGRRKGSTRSPDSSRESRERATSRADGATASSRS